MEKTFQPKKKPQKTTVSISGETSERLEVYCREKDILRKDFVDLALSYFERTGYDLRENKIDYTPMEKIISELTEIKKAMNQSCLEKEVMLQLIQAVQEQTQIQLPAPEVLAKAIDDKNEAEIKLFKFSIENENLKREIQNYEKEDAVLKKKIKELEEYKGRAYKELCRIRDEQCRFGKIEVNTEI